MTVAKNHDIPFSVKKNQWSLTSTNKRRGSENLARKELHAKTSANENTTWTSLDPEVCRYEYQAAEG